MKYSNIEDIKKKVSVKPVASGGANFETHVLIKTNIGYEFKSTTGYALFCGIFSILGYGFLLFAIFKIYELGNLNFIFENPTVSIVGFVFFCVGNFLLYQFLKPIVFNRSTRQFYKGFSNTIINSELKKTSFDEIVALQIIGEFVENEDSNYNSFELNMVLNNLNRINLIDHSKLKSLIMDAETLSKFLNVPVWHATSGKD
jgi:hypothetical protein